MAFKGKDTLNSHCIALSLYWPFLYLPTLNAFLQIKSIPGHLSLKDLWEHWAIMKGYLFTVRRDGFCLLKLFDQILCGVIKEQMN